MWKDLYLNREQKWAMLGTSFQLCKSELSLEPAVDDEVVELAYFTDFFEPPILPKILEDFYLKLPPLAEVQHNKNKVLS